MGQRDKSIDRGINNRVKSAANDEKDNVGPIVSNEESHGSIDYKINEQHIREPVTHSGRVQVALDERFSCEVQIYAEEDEWRNQLDGNLLFEKSFDLFHVPYDIRFVQNETADEEEHRHAHLHEEVVERHPPAHVPAECRHMLEYDQNHCDASQGVNVFDAFTGFLDGLLYHLLINFLGDLGLVHALEFGTGLFPLGHDFFKFAADA